MIHLPCGFLHRTTQELLEESAQPAWYQVKRNHVLLPRVPQDQSLSNVLRQGIQRLPILSCLRAQFWCPHQSSLSFKSLYQLFLLCSQVKMVSWAQRISPKATIDMYTELVLPRDGGVLRQLDSWWFATTISQAFPKQVNGFISPV